METSTPSQARKEGAVPEMVAPLIQDWDQVAQMMPTDLEKLAMETGALVRRRGIRRAIDLLRIVMAYAICDWSLRLISAWCVVMGIADVSDVAILNRLRKSTTWLGCLIVRLLQRRHLRLAQAPGVRLRLIDATTVSKPGSQGTDWRIHVSLDLEQMSLDGMEVTDAHGGESLVRFPGQPGEIKVADRGYAFASSLAPDVAAGVGLVVRITWRNLPLEDQEGERFDLIAWLRNIFCSAAVQGPQETQVWLATPEGRYPLRLVAVALPQEKADRARQRAWKRANKKGQTPDPRTLFAAGFVLLLTNLPPDEWPASRIVTLYRLRWQIELLFKRLKSLLHLDDLRAHDPRLAQTYLLGKLLGALLLDELTQATTTRVPEWFHTLERPVSPWRLTACLYEAWRHLVSGPFWPAQVMEALPNLQRFLCDSPRKRRQQLAWARIWFANLSAC